MPAKNSRKIFAPNSYYHIYNRGVEKRTIFLENIDYNVFLSYIKTYILPKDEKTLNYIISDPKAEWKEKNKAIKLLRLNNFFKSLSLISYCLMPNHFHLLVKQKEENIIDRFMNSFCTRYSMYFNKKYKRIGTLFQGVYKAVLVDSDEQLHHLSRYIHRNPLPLLQGEALRSYPYSSYPTYLYKSDTKWLDTKIILDNFSPKGRNSYEYFVEGQDNEETTRIIGKLTLE